MAFTLAPRVAKQYNLYMPLSLTLRKLSPRVSRNYWPTGLVWPIRCPSHALLVLPPTFIVAWKWPSTFSVMLKTSLYR